MATRTGPTRSPTLTFLFTDIEGHSALWNEHGEVMSEALRAHDELIAHAIGEAGGRVVKNEGDGAMAVFADSAAAVDAALAIQRALADRTWPGIGQLRVRMGLNAGVAESRDGDFFGPEVIRAARLCQAANGGQVVASRAVTELARDASWLDLGSHRLRGFADPLEMFQVVSDGLESQFPPLRTLDVHPNTLPRFRTEFFGREQEINAIGDLLTENRLVTLTGVGGSGKTRLAVEVAHAQLGSFPDGAYFADLSVVTDPDRLWDAVAAAIEFETGAAVRQSESAREVISRFLGGRRALLVLDNCEHLLDDAAELIETLLDATEQLTIVATSREGLHVEGERMVQVPSLPLATDALKLFQDRAAAAGTADVDDATAIRICERLDGLPLALELAAARAGQLGVAEVARGLDDRFQLLTGGRRRIPRQRTLEATLDWSHDLLGEDERTVLRRLAVFTGSFTLRAAVAVTGGSVDAVGALVDKSLVQRADGDRFRLLETVRTYAEQRLVQAGEADATRQAHVDHLLADLESFADESLMLGDVEFGRYVTSELENLFAAMEWTVAREDWTLTARLAIPTAFAGAAGNERFRPVVVFLRQALDAGLDGAMRDRALAAHVAVPHLQAFARRPDLWREAGARAWDGDDAASVFTLAYVAMTSDARSRVGGDQAGIELAGALVERSLQIARALGPHWEAIPTYLDALLALNASDWERAAAQARATRAIRERTGIGQQRVDEPLIEAAARFALGDPLDRDELDGRVRSSMGVEGLTMTTDVFTMACSAPDPARPRQAMDIDRSDVDRLDQYSRSTFVICVAVLAAREGDWPVAARLLASARSTDGIFTSESAMPLYRITVAQLHDELDKPNRDALIAEGRSLGQPGGIDLALRWLRMQA